MTAFGGLCNTVFVMAVIIAMVVDLRAEDRTIDSMCEAFPQLHMCDSLASAETTTKAPPSLPQNLSFKGSLLAKAFEPRRPQYMRFGKRFEDGPFIPGAYKKFGKQRSSYMRFGKRSDNVEKYGKQKSSYMRFGKRSDSFEGYGDE